MECQDVGEANPDIAGIGILLSFGIQAFIAIVISFWIEIFNQEWADDEKARKRREVGQSALLAGNDIQLVTGTTTKGITLLISALIQIRSLSFYHQHVIYDTVSFVAISIAAATCCSFSADMDHIRARYALIVIWMILYLIFTCLFAVHLNSWSFDVSGHCYNTSHISLPNARHPYVDHIYIAFTCLYVLSSVYLSVAIANSKGLLHKLSNMESYNFNVTRSMIVLLLALFSISTPYHFMVLNIAMLQYPLHVYTLFTIRANNEGSLTNGSEEKQWGFAQIGAMVLLATNVLLLLNGVQDYWNWSRKEVSGHREERFQGRGICRRQSV